MDGGSGNASQDGSYDEPRVTWPKQGHEHFLPGMTADDRPPRRRRAGCVVLVLISVAVIAGVAGAFAVNALPRKQDAAGVHSAASRKENTAGFRPTAPRPQDTAGFHPSGQSLSGDAEQLTTAFLRAWSSGAIGAAATLTDDPAAARAALTAYGHDLYLRKLTGTRGQQHPGTSATGSAGDAQATGVSTAATLEAVTFSLSATVAGSAASNAESGTWSYHSALTAYQVPDGTGWLVEWDPSVVAPNLSDGQHLATVLVPSQSTSVTDSAGNPLSSSYSDPGLAHIASLLAGMPRPRRHARAVRADRGLRRPGGTRQPGHGYLAQSQPGGHHDQPAGRTGRAQRRQRRGRQRDRVLQPSTGDILAIANNAQFNDYALTAVVPPGSTMKIITATALINDGLASENSPVTCPADVHGAGRHVQQRQRRVRASGHAVLHRLRAVLQQRVLPVVDAAERAAGVDRADILRARPAVEHRPSRRAGQLLQRSRRRLGIGAGGGGIRPGGADGLAAGDGIGGRDRRLRAVPQPVLVPGTATVSASPLPASTDGS